MFRTMPGGFLVGRLVGGFLGRGSYNAGSCAACCMASKFASVWLGIGLKLLYEIYLDWFVVGGLIG